MIQKINITKKERDKKDWKKERKEYCKEKKKTSKSGRINEKKEARKKLMKKGWREEKKKGNNEGKKDRRHVSFELPINHHGNRLQAPFDVF